MITEYPQWAWIATAIILSLSLFASVVQGQDKKTKEDFSFQQPTPDELQAMQKRWAETMIPSKYHRWLGQLIGKWTTKTKMIWGADGPPSESSGEAEIEWKVKDKWLSWVAKSNMMGMPITMHATKGYDNFKQKFVSLSFDDQTTAAYRFEGNLDQTGTVLSLWGTVDEPMTGEHDKASKYVVRILSQDKFVHEVHDLTIGGDKTMVVETTYSRKK